MSPADGPLVVCRAAAAEGSEGLDTEWKGEMTRGRPEDSAPKQDREETEAISAAPLLPATFRSKDIVICEVDGRWWEVRN